MPEDQISRVVTEASSAGESQEVQQGVSSDFNRVRAVVAEGGKNRVGSLLEHSVYNDYGIGNPRIASDIASHTRIIREIATKNGTNSDGELLGLEELIKWASDSQEQKEKTIRAYSLYLYLEQEIAGIADELKESKRDYIIFLQEKIAELSGVIGSSVNTKPTLFRKILPVVRKYALAVTSVVALGSLGYARHLKNENSQLLLEIYNYRDALDNADIRDRNSKEYSERILKGEQDKNQQGRRYLEDILASTNKSLERANKSLEEAKNGVFEKSVTEIEIFNAIETKGAADRFMCRLDLLSRSGSDIDSCFDSSEDKINYVTRYPIDHIKKDGKVIGTYDLNGKYHPAEVENKINEIIKRADDQYFKAHPDRIWEGQIGGLP